jgi:hypothetical protein
MGRQGRAGSGNGADVWWLIGCKPLFSTHRREGEVADLEADRHGNQRIYDCSDGKHPADCGDRHPHWKPPGQPWQRATLRPTGQVVPIGRRKRRSTSPGHAVRSLSVAVRHPPRAKLGAGFRDRALFGRQLSHGAGALCGAQLEPAQERDARPLAVRRTALAGHAAALGTPMRGLS